jgi:hypothetical protein
VNATETVHDEIVVTAKQCIEVSKTLFDAEKGRFARAALENPAAAIKAAETVLERQYAYEAWLQVGKFIGLYNVDTARVAVTNCVASLKDDLSRSIDKVTFDTVLGHAQHGCYQRALKYVIEQVEELLKVCN